MYLIQDHFPKKDRDYLIRIIFRKKRLIVSNRGQITVPFVGQFSVPYHGHPVGYCL